jgi:hypothetical protein
VGCTILGRQCVCKLGHTRARAGTTFDTLLKRDNVRIMAAGAFARHVTLKTCTLDGLSYYASGADAAPTKTTARQNCTPCACTRVTSLGCVWGKKCVKCNLLVPTIRAHARIRKHIVWVHHKCFTDPRFHLLSVAQRVWYVCATTAGGAQARAAATDLRYSHSRRPPT